MKEIAPIVFVFIPLALMVVVALMPLVRLIQLMAEDFGWWRRRP